MCIRSFLITCLALITVAKANDVQIRPLVARAANNFSYSLFEVVAEENNDTPNLISSPLSAGIVLGMTAYGARGETEKQFKQVLNLPSGNLRGETGYLEIIENFDDVKENKLILANKIFSNARYKIKKSYTNLTKTYFKSAVQAVDFNNSVNAASTINEWVEQNTENLIQNLIQPDDLDESTLIVLVNALYFKGEWKYKFDANKTTDRPFHVDENTTKNVPTMYINGSYQFGFVEELNATFVVLPYKGDELSLLIIIPNEINGLSEVERKLQNVSLSSILSSGFKRELYLYLPKFKAESTLNLNNPLQKLGLVDAFSSGADFSGISSLPLAISKVVQKAYIEVNEEGTEAAAATAVIITRELALPPVPPTILRINRPFHFSIVKPLSQNREANIDDAITIFSGHIKEPKY